MKKLHVYNIILVILFFLAACTPSPTDQDACIQPLTNFAYFTGQGTPYPDRPVAPPAPWAVDRTIDMQYPVLLGVRNLPDQGKEFWLWEAGSGSSNVNARQQRLFVLRTDGTGLMPVLLDEGSSEIAFPINVEKLLIGRDNSVWIVYRTSRVSNFPILGKYDEVSGRMIPVTKLTGIKHFLDYQTTVLMDEKTGVFWFLVPYGYIYSYDPASDTLIQHIAIADMNPTSATMTSDGRIFMYLFRYGSPTDGEHDALFLYSPQTETIEYKALGLEVDFYTKNLFVDHSGRLWAGSFGWMEPNGDWYQMVRQDAFILAANEPRGERIYHWVPPDIRFEAPGDTYWFTSTEGGTYSLDFKNRDWCWVSTSSNLQIDVDGNLWMIVGKAVYILPVNSR